MRQLYLIAYDISDSRRRRQVLRAVKANTAGGQKSVYECWLDEVERRALHAVLAPLVEGDRDRIVLIRLDPRASVHTLGVAIAPAANDDLFYLD